MADLINQEVIDNIINTPTFLTALKGLNNDIRLKLERVLNDAFTQGLGVKQIVANIRKVLDIGFRQAQAVIRTESHRLTEAAHYQEFLDTQAQGINTRMKLVATLDDRTRPQSAQMDGQVSDKDGLFQYPDGTWGVPGNTGVAKYDINDRCRSIQIIDGVSPEIRRSREDGLIPYQTFEEWAKDKGMTKNIYGQKLF